MDTEIQKFSDREVKKITAIWAFTESILGGILHSLRIPFTGLILGGLAIVFLYLIAISSKNKSQIIQSTFIVTSIKFLLSPNTPFTAYIAVIFQGLIAYLIFNSLGMKKISVILLGVFSMLYSSIQKIVLTTIIFGMTFWHAIDDFTNYVMKLFGVNAFENLSMSLILIIVYFALHLAGALFFSNIAVKIQSVLYIESKKYLEIIQKYQEKENLLNEFGAEINRMSKKWYYKPTRIFLIIFFIFLASITLINPELKKITFLNVLSMVIRAIIIIFLWFKVVSPFLIKMLSKFLRSSSLSRVENLNEFTELFPKFRHLIRIAWIENANRKGIKRLIYFLKDSLILLMI